MKNHSRLILLGLALLITFLYVYQFEPRLRVHLKKDWPAVEKVASGLSSLQKKTGFDLRWAFPILFGIFWMIEFGGSGKDSPLARQMALIMAIGLGLTAALIYYIYSLPHDRVQLGSMIIERGNRETFLQTVLHYSILLGSAHLISLLGLAWWIHQSSPPKGKYKKGKQP